MMSAFAGSYTESWLVGDISGRSTFCSCDTATCCPMATWVTICSPPRGGASRSFTGAAAFASATGMMRTAPSGPSSAVKPCAFKADRNTWKAQGFTAVDGPEGAVRIIPVAEAKAAAPVNERDAPPRGGEQIVTQVAIGQHVAVSQLQNVLRPLMSPTSQLSVYDPANALIITDYADNVRRLLRILERIDVPAGTEVIVVPLQNASAIDLAELVVRLSGSGVATPGIPGAPQTQIAAGGDRFSVVPDTRTNSLLLRSDNPGRIAQLRALIEKLDVPARAMGSTRVIYLRHAEAVKLVEVLRGMLSAVAAGSA